MDLHGLSPTYRDHADDSDALTTRTAKIIGVERAPAMLAVARAHAQRSGHPGWTLIEADARQLPLPDRCADLVAGWVFGHFRAWMLHRGATARTKVQITTARRFV